MDSTGSTGDEVSLAERGQRKEDSKGMSLWLAAVFIVGEMAGSGVLALPRSFADSGWSGIALLFVCCFNALYCGICLGRCWMILEERWAEYKEKVRYPYPAIASRAVAPWMRYVVSFCVDFTLFGVATVFLLLSSQMIGDLAAKFGITFCYWILILAAFLCPLMWLGTPDDFWPAAVVALITTVTACILLFASVIRDRTEVTNVEYKKPSISSFFLAFGTILFSFGGASTFPTFQNDMKDRSQFPKAAIIGFSVLLILYLPVSTVGYKVYGSGVEQNIIKSLTEAQSTLRIVIEVLLAIHLFFAFLIAINPTAQEIEEFFKVPKKFCWQRCAVRSGIMLLVIFVAMSIPNFGKVLDLVGGSTVTLMTFVFPPVFYMRLCAQQKPEWPVRTIPLHEKVYLYEILLLGIVGGVISTYSAISNIAKDSAFTPPCYVNFTASAG